MAGLIRSMTRPAAVVGAATATRNAVNRRHVERNVRAFNNAMNAAQTQHAPSQPLQHVQPVAVIPKQME